MKYYCLSEQREKGEVLNLVWGGDCDPRTTETSSHPPVHGLGFRVRIKLGL
jgi:hypothetical protein